MGNDGFLLRNEVFLYVFDAVLMLGVMVLVNLVHPGEIAAMIRGMGGQGTLLDSRGLRQEGGVERVRK